MARKRKETVEKTIKLKQSELKAAIVDAARHRANAKSHSDFHGEAVKLFCERTNFDRTVFGWLRKLHEINDELKRQAMIRQLLMGVTLLDWNKQGDLFDDVDEEIANKASLDGAGKPADEEDDPRQAFLKGAMPLDEAEAAFTKANEDNPAPGFGEATREVVAEANAPKRKRVTVDQLQAELKAGKAQRPAIGDVEGNA